MHGGIATELKSRPLVRMFAFARQRFSFVIMGFLLIYVAAVFTFLYPVYQGGNQFGPAPNRALVEPLLENNQGYIQVREWIDGKVLKRPVSFSAKINPFLEGRFEAWPGKLSYMEDNQQKTRDEVFENFRLIVRWDIIAIWTAALLSVGGLVYAFLSWSALSERPATSPTELSVEAIKLGTAEDVLTHQMNFAWGRTRNADFRAILMLIAGIGFAVFGIFMFYLLFLNTEQLAFSSPKISGQPQSDVPSDDMVRWLSYLRPISVLVVAEVIAFFLLRQYRALIEDQKWFFKIFIKRGNFLAAAQMATQRSRAVGLDAVATVLLSEELSIRLKVGETTEELRIKENDASAFSHALDTITRMFRDGPEKK